MDLIQGIWGVFSPSNLLYCFVGCLTGTLVGVLPGLGPASTLAILLPLTTYLDSTGAIIMLAGIFYGAQYGGSTTSILMNIPGESSSVATCLDGFQMTRQGRAGQALWIAAVGSFLAGTLTTIAISFVGPGIARYALRFGPPEYFGLVFLSLAMLVSLSGASLMKGVTAGIFGILLSTMGVDPLLGTARFSFGSIGLMRGLEIIPLVVGLFGIGEILDSAEAGISRIYEGQLGKMMPRGQELRRGILASIRGTIVGFLPGMLPGMLPTLTTFMAYDVEKRISKHPEGFGAGAIEGVAGPEAANNATAQAGFIPLMTLGIPTGPSMAIILVALMMYGLQPGPLLFQTNKQFVWTVVGSMYIGNVILLILNLPLVGLWARISMIPYKFLAPVILAICVVGSYSIRNTLFDVWISIGAGVAGYIMKKYKWPVTPLILGFVLGPMLEQALRQSMPMGGPIIFVKRPITFAFLLFSVVFILASLKYLRRVPRELLEDDSGT